MPDELTRYTSGLSVDQCHELLKLSTLRATGPLQVKDFPAYLSQTRDDAIRALLTNLDTRLAEAGLSPRLLKSTPLFVGTAVNPPMIIPSGRFVGFQFRLMQDDVTMTLDRLQAPPVELKLVNEDTGEEQTIDGTGEWQNAGIQLQAGYGYLLTYDESELGETIARNTITQWPATKSKCRGCVSKCLTHYLCIDAIAGNGQGSMLSKDTNYGINLVFSASGDVSGRLADDPRRLISALRHQMAVTFLEKIAYSTRANGPTEEAKQGALFALTDKNNTDRVPAKLDKALSALVKGLTAEASSALDITQQDEITWSSI